MVQRQRNPFAWRACAWAAVGLLVLTSCSSLQEAADGRKLVIATTNFSETRILARIYEQVLEANGVSVGVKELTTREVIAPALSSGQVQVAPEYLGSFATYLNDRVNGPGAPAGASGDVEATFAAASALAGAENITLLPPSQAQNQNAFAVTEAFAEQHGITTMSELAAYSQANPITLGGAPECPQRPFCLPGIQQTYGVKVDQFLSLDVGPLTINAIKQGTVNVGHVLSSSPSVAVNGLVVLTDDKGLQTPENILPAVYTPALTDTIERALNSVSQALTMQELQQMNQQVDIDRMDPEDVAEQFLVRNGVL